VTLQEKHYEKMIKPFFEMCMVTKTLNDEKVVHFSFKLFARVLGFVNHCAAAIELAYFMLDLSMDMMELPKVMDCYQLLGTLLESHKEYKTAMVAYRKMLQMAWYL